MRNTLQAERSAATPNQFISVCSSDASAAMSVAGGISNTVPAAQLGEFAHELAVLLSFEIQQESE